MTGGAIAKPTRATANTTTAGRAATAGDDLEEENGIPFYPQYCFKLSPTINIYCHIRASDIEALMTHSGFGGQNVFFHRNHPVQWVRIAGIVVAVDEYSSRRIYTVDDSSAIPARKTDSNSTNKPASKGGMTPIVTVPEEIDVGTIIDVKGGLALFRGHKQIRILRATVLRSTEQELAFWEKVKQLRETVLDKPWQLTDKEVRRCRKDEERRR